MNYIVACSTVTVTKCLAALKTLQAFPFFRPTCLCKEPGLDPECNNFRDFLFDHPCGMVSKRGIINLKTAHRNGCQIKNLIFISCLGEQQKKIHIQLMHYQHVTML